MYTLKSSELKRLTVAEIQAAGLPEGRIFQLLLTFVLSKSADENEDIGVSTFIDNEADAINAINQNIARLNAQEELIAKVAAGTFTIVVPEPVVVELTPEEIEQQREQKKIEELTQLKTMLEVKRITIEEYEARVAAINAAAVIAK